MGWRSLLIAGCKSKRGCNSCKFRRCEWALSDHYSDIFSRNLENGGIAPATIYAAHIKVQVEVVDGVPELPTIAAKPTSSYFGGLSLPFKDLILMVALTYKEVTSIFYLGKEEALV